MITNNQAKEAIKTIAEYCEQFDRIACHEGKCILRPLCDGPIMDTNPEEWPGYLEAENEEEGEKNDR